MLHPRLRSELLEQYAMLTRDGSLPSRSAVQGYLDNFRRRFGPEVIRSMDGIALLRHLHALSTKESLTYWLEFKNDDEFRDVFGSVAGGSALKYQIYLKADRSGWATRGAGPAPVDISEDEAIAVARRHGEQLVRAAEVVARMPEDGDDARYLQLQQELERVAPDVANTVWGHKYLALLFPERIDPFHVPKYQQYHATRLLQLPSGSGTKWPDGRYALGGRFVAVARELELTCLETARALVGRHGAPRSYWRVGTTDDEKSRRKYWPYMRDLNVVAIGWEKLGDLSALEANDESRAQLRTLMKQHYQDHYQGNLGLVTRGANQVWKFVASIAVGDRVVASDGQTVLGVGEVEGRYAFNGSHPFPHQRPVRWKSLAEWKSADAEGLRTTVAELRDARNLVEIERRILEDERSVSQTAVGAHVVWEEPPATSMGRPPLPILTETAGIIQSVLERKGQAILYGPPGTGKTYWALSTAKDLASLRRYGVKFAGLSPDQQREIIEGTKSTPALVRITSFHPEYGYEDFIEGFRPNSDRSGALTFSLVPGIFRRLCTDAFGSPDLDFYLVVDEINRGDVPRIFGELLTLLEKDKRGQGVVLPASGDTFRVPPNVFVIGTMNTADRSIALLDVALRRRFGFVELMPDYTTLKDSKVGALPLALWLKRLNEKVRKVGGSDSRNRQVGHAYFLGPNGSPVASIDHFSAILRDDIIPLLEEYAYDSFADLAEVLGRKLIDVESQRVRRELFDPGRGDALIDSQLHEEFASSAEVIDSEETDDIGEDEDEPSPDAESSDGARS